MNEGRQPPEPGQHGQPLGEIRVCQRCSYSPTLGAAAAYQVACAFLKNDHPDDAR